MHNPATPSDLQMELEKRILMGLSHEWELTASDQEYQTGHQMDRPLFALRDMKRVLGVWSADKREIALSRKFVLNYPWDAVREVLNHEIAHQFTHEILGKCDEPPHGPAFMEACRILRANPSASGRYDPLQDRLHGEDASKIVVKIRKLLALSESSNRHEAEAAMKKAHEMIGRYNVDLLKLNEKRNFISIFIGKPALRHPREAHHLAGLLQEFYFVQGIWVSAFVMEKARMGRVLEISGTCQNTRMAAYVYDYIHHYIDGQWRIYNQHHKKTLNRHRKTDFAVGIIEGFREKLRDSEVIPKELNVETTALSKCNDPQLDRYIRYRYPYLRSRRPASRRCDTTVIENGRQLGRRLIISKGVHNKSHSEKLLGYDD